MNFARVFFIAIMLVCASAVLAGVSLVQKTFYEIYAPVQVSAEVEKQIQRKEDYRINLSNLFSSYNNGQISLAELEEDLLALSVPSGYQALHADLVISVNGLEKQPSNAIFKDKLLEIEKKYSWLSSLISYFVTNNF